MTTTRPYRPHNVSGGPHGIELGQVASSIPHRQGVLEMPTNIWEDLRKTLTAEPFFSKV